MKDIEKLRPEADMHLMDRDPKTCSLAFFRAHNSSCESVENGFSESFNSVILDARKKPIINMLEEIRIYVKQKDGGGEDVVMGDAFEPHAKEVVRVNEYEDAVRDNEAKELGKVNEVVGRVYSTCQPRKRKKYERILKLKLAKRVEGESSSVISPMELD
ncbi:unnamed protein product [Lactuca saligna]|uniref:Uncharacterized protein n=1 Tax=Lactuca saligna TaxID=75948 RepID=A0AA35VLC8_LACSI|nr:unnamed protein product [Lactuca saligna]